MLRQALYFGVVVLVILCSLTAYGYLSEAVDRAAKAQSNQRLLNDASVKMVAACANASTMAAYMAEGDHPTSLAIKARLACSDQLEESGLSEEAKDAAIWNGINAARKSYTDIIKPDQ